MKKGQRVEKPRDVGVKINLTPEEKAKLQKAADKAQLPLSVWFRSEVLKLVNK